MNSLQPLVKSRGHGQKKNTKSKSTSKYIFDSNIRNQRKSGGTADRQSSMLNVNDPLKNIQLKNGLRSENVSRMTE